MANLDSSWQASIVKLAQAGNSRAIAFWINRYLVPQGVCAQVLNEPSGLLIRVVCRQVPDADRLVRFICHRLCKLESETIQQVRITAQMVGSTEVLWEKSARLISPANRKPSDVGQSTKNPSDNLYPFPPIQEVTLLEPPGAASAVHDQPIAPIANPVTKLPDPVRRRAAVSPAPVGKFRLSLRLSPLPKNWNELSAAWQEDWQPQIHGQIRAWRTNSLDVTDRTIRWIARQNSLTRAALLGGSAVTAFLIGCSFELVGYYADPVAFQRSKAALTKVWQSASAHSGSVNTAAERVSVIRQAVLNPDDPTVSLVFANSATLTRLSGSQLKPTSPDVAVPLVNEVEPYRLADMLITSLDSPLSITPPEKPDAKPDSKSDTESDTSGPAEPHAADTAPDLNPTEADQAETAELSDAELKETSEGEPEASELLLSDAVSEEDGSLLAEDALEGERLSLGVVDPEDGEAEAAEKDYGFHPVQTVVPLMPQELLANGVDVVNVASAAVMPESVAQLTHTLSLLKQNSLYPVGAGEDLVEARRPQIFDVKGQRIAYLGYSDSSPRPVRMSAAGSNVSVNQQMEADIKAIRDHVDWIVINFSWNREVRAYPESWQVELTHAAIDHGADLVVGYHPTVTQGAEIYNGRAIVYSLGNAIDEYSEKPTGNYDTAALKVTLKEHVMELEFLPIQVKKGRAQLAKSALGTTILEYVRQASSLFDHPLKSPTSLNSQIRLSLPAAPDAKMPTEPFIGYPESPSPDSSDSPSSQESL